ncbi:SgcJ/EcaC family oxidoreductase [Nocardia blacklockiae]|uniref:SgcJ/EcaC family oxidoreductase n=1 Tax=Nocardia blacklockiae TaxID=480036 RepID=UPI0018938C0C|nr:SgcJ/EcaC family oxidoreductase [Nocardia blacklockiae]MBF6175595.1 SgcJ/EcaC family oxidoreductase [Nocardia blacklockiae]
MDADDEQRIRDTLATHTDLWIRHEMRRWSEYFTEDCDFITHRGLWWRTRTENVAGHVDVPESVLAQKKNYSQEVVKISEIAPGVALVHTEWRWPGHVLPHAPAADRRGFITLVLVERGGAWLIRAAHNTRLNGLDDFEAA